MTDEDTVEMAQSDSNTVKKELLEAKDEEKMNVTNGENQNQKRSEENEPEQEGEKQEVNGLKKVTKEEKCSPERVMEKNAEDEKIGGSAKKKAISSFFGELFLRSSLFCLSAAFMFP